MNLLTNFFAATWRWRTWRVWSYLVLGLPLGVLWGVYAVTMYAVSFSLVVIWVGVPLFLVTHLSMRAVSSFERRMVNGMLGESIGPAGRFDPQLPPEVRGWARVQRWAMSVLHDSVSWRAFAWTSIRLVTGPVGFALALVAVIVPLVLAIVFGAAVLIDTGAISGSDRVYVGGGSHLDDWTWVGYAAGAALLLLAPTLAWTLRGYAYLHQMLARWALSACVDDQVRAQQARADIAEEQVRIDQELHDSIGHMITMNIVQAGAGAHVFDSDPEFARQALRNIEERGRAAMGELDRIIAAIRGDEPETRRPLPGLADLGDLIAQSQAAGMTVSAELDPPEVPAALGRATFGIVREALTNAAKHAPGAPVEVVVTRDGDALAVAVVNGAAEAAPGSPAAPSSGRGLGGIRDRATLLGGRTRVGATDDGGFEVLALLPLEATLAGDAPDGSRWAALREKVTA